MPPTKLPPRVKQSIGALGDVCDEHEAFLDAASVKGPTALETFNAFQLRKPRFRRAFDDLVDQEIKWRGNPSTAARVSATLARATSIMRRVEAFETKFLSKNCGFRL
jgi:hypothetical protein